MEAGSVYPAHTLGEELILIGRDGTATVEFDGKTAEMREGSASSISNPAPNGQ